MLLRAVQQRFLFTVLVKMIRRKGRSVKRA
jgi:hypothetical protein